MVNSIIKIPKPLDKFLNKFSNIFDKRTFDSFKVYMAGSFLELKSNHGFKKTIGLP